MTREEIEKVWDEHTTAFLANARGVVHIGANDGEEREIYARYGLPVIWIEPLPVVFEALRVNLIGFPSQRAYRYLITDEDGKEYTFGVANNDGQSSSIFPFGDHWKLWPQVSYTHNITLRGTTFKTFVEREEIDLGGYDTLILDVQAAELMVLRGAGDLLSAFRYIRCEAADFEIYKGGCTLKELDYYLAERDFARIQTWAGAGKPDVGYAYEALYQYAGIPSPTIIAFDWKNGGAPREV